MFKGRINRCGSNAHLNSLTRGNNNTHCFYSDGDRTSLKANLAISPCFLFSKSELAHVIDYAPLHSTIRCFSGSAQPPIFSLFNSICPLIIDSGGFQTTLASFIPVSNESQVHTFIKLAKKTAFGNRRRKWIILF